MCIHSEYNNCGILNQCKFYHNKIYDLYVRVLYRKSVNSLNAYISKINIFNRQHICMSCMSDIKQSYKKWLPIYIFSP